MNRSRAAKLAFFISTALNPACDKGGPGGGTPCTIVNQQSLDELDGADWPDGLAEMVDSYLEADGAWTVDVRCETHPEYDGTATLSLEQCSVSDMQLNTMEGDACDDTTLLVHCSDGSISLAGWDLFEHAGSSASRMEYTDAVWTHWVASARLEESELRVSWTDGELSGLVEPVMDDFYCVLEGFEPT